MCVYILHLRAALIQVFSQLYMQLLNVHACVNLALQHVLCSPVHHSALLPMSQLRVDSSSTQLTVEQLLAVTLGTVTTTTHHPLNPTLCSNHCGSSMSHT
jgi:hypothetical protein